MKLKTLAAAGITAAFLLTLTACGGNTGSPLFHTVPHYRRHLSGA